jgi:hypothetical protein
VNPVCLKLNDTHSVYQDQFLQLVNELELDAPQSHLIESPKEALDLFREPGQSPMILKAANVLDDVGRSDLTTFPLLDDHGRPDWKRTEARLKTGLFIPMTPKTPYAAQEFIGGHGASEWCTHATVHQGKITAFVCCPSVSFCSLASYSSNLFVLFFPFPHTERHAHDVPQCDTLDTGQKSAPLDRDLPCSPRQASRLEWYCFDGPVLHGLYTPACFRSLRRH